MLYASLIIIVGGLLFVLIETVRTKNTGFETKTLWDWMELLIIPLVLAFGAFWLNRSERDVERQTAENRSKLEREIATDRQQEMALQSYLDRMSDLLLEKKLRTAKSDEVRNVARMRTLTVLRGLDPTRKGFVLRFLYEGNLIASKNTIVELKGGDLRKADLSGANLSEAALSGVVLSDANLIYSFLQNANLSDARLSDARLSNVDLSGADLSSATLSNADLSAATLSDADLSGAYLSDANLRGANLSGGNLRGAYLGNAKLNYADLSDADLSVATLSDADLSSASLQNTIVTDKQLATAASLQGATMPDGTKHE